MRAAATTFALLLGLAACAEGPAEKNLALATSGQLELHEGQVKDFVAAQSQLNAASARELDALAGDAAAARGVVDRQTLAWTLAQKRDLLAQAQLATSVGPAAIVEATSTTTTTAAALADSGSSAALDGADTTLKALAAAKPGALDDLKETMATFASVNAALAALQTKTAAAPAAPPAAAAKPPAPTPPAAPAAAPPATQ